MALKKGIGTVLFIVGILLIGLVGWSALYLWVLSLVPELFWVQILILATAIILAVLFIGVMIQRIREILKGEEDDLSQY